MRLGEPRPEDENQDCSSDEEDVEDVQPIQNHISVVPIERWDESYEYLSSDLEDDDSETSQSSVDLYPIEDLVHYVDSEDGKDSNDDKDSEDGEGSDDGEGSEYEENSENEEGSEDVENSENDEYSEDGDASENSECSEYEENSENDEGSEDVENSENDEYSENGEGSEEGRGSEDEEGSENIEDSENVENSENVEDSENAEVSGDGEELEYTIEEYEVPTEETDATGEAKPRGICSCYIETLPCYTFPGEALQREDPQSSCVVCMADFEAQQLLRVLPCTHEFHAECVDKWLQTHRSCPVCRQNVTDEDCCAE